MKTLQRMAGLLAISASSLLAGSFSFTGTFVTDDQVELFDLTLASTSSVTFETLSYGGGTNSLGNTIDPGGFDTRLTWYQSDGTEIGSDDGGHCGDTNSYLGACNDAFFNGTLAAGSYILALTQDGNDPNGALSDGFSEQGNPNFTATGACAQFCDSLSGDQLTGNWAVDILAVDSASAQSSTPEPGTTALTGIGLYLLGLTARSRRAGAARRLRPGSR
jgi:hypothetical protein